MTLQELSQIKRWLVLHRGQHPVESQAWDVVFLCWVLGWTGVPGLLLTHSPAWLPACLLGFMLPTLYGRLRRHLHRRGRLRCDWLTAL
jgi:hypothetical protein